MRIILTETLSFQNEKEVFETKDDWIEAMSETAKMIEEANLPVVEDIIFKGEIGRVTVYLRESDNE